MQPGMLRVFSVSALIVLIHVCAIIETGMSYSEHDVALLRFGVPIFILIVSGIDGYLYGFNLLWMIIPSLAIQAFGLIWPVLFPLSFELAVIYAAVGFVANGLVAVFTGANDDEFVPLNSEFKGTPGLVNIGIFEIYLGLALL